MYTTCVDTHTPRLTVIDPRRLAVRSVDYCRSAVTLPAELHVTRQVFDPAGREIERHDPRLFAQGKGPNRTSVYALSGSELSSVSVDRGWTLRISGEAGQMLQRWDSRSTQQREYDRLLRPVAVSEQLGDDPSRVVERFTYGDASGNARNQCGQLIRHDDPSTTRHMPDYDLRGMPLLEISHFLASLAPVHWPQAVAARDALLEGAPGLGSHWSYDALGEVITHTDAMHNARRYRRTCAGQMRAVYLQPAHGSETTLVSAIRYSAGGLVEQETAGNGVISSAVFRPEDARLEQLSAGLPGQPLLQDLHHAYDPVGNPLQIDDRSRSITHFHNQRVDPVSTYTYDSRYRLISATGREVYRAANDPNALVNYREEYTYDAGDNPLETRHLGAQPFTRHWVVAADSNRSLLVFDDEPPDLARAFDGNGNQRQLLRGQALHWDARNQLSQVTPVRRATGADDHECYAYGGGGKRLRKVRCAMTAGRSVLSEVRYLPGLEIHRGADGEERHVIEVEAGRNQVRRLHWCGSPPTGVDNDHLSYSVCDPLRSSLLELDEQGGVLSDEGYLPFRGRAWWVAHHGAKASFKTRGYSGKERDATGLYYYGYRYYASWQQRWLNPDPAGEVDGLNVYGFVGNSPVRFLDRDGRVGEDGAIDPEDERFLLSLIYGETQATAETSAVFETPAATLQMEPERNQNEETNGQWLVPLVDTATFGPEAVAVVTFPTASQPLPVPLTSTAQQLPAPTTSAAAQTVPAGEGPFKCASCGKNFAKKRNLKTHTLTHTGKKPHECAICHKTFARKRTLKTHERIHTEEKPYKCTACDKLFSHCNTLKAHERTHTGEKPYQCEVCDKSFSFPSSFIQHKRIHTGKTPYACSVCNRGFSQSSNMHTHRRKHHPASGSSKT